MLLPLLISSILCSPITLSLTEQSLFNLLLGIFVISYYTPFCSCGPIGIRQFKNYFFGIFENKFVQIFGNTLQVCSVFKYKQNTKSGRAPSQEVPLDPPSPRFNLTELDKAEEKEWMNGTFRLSFLLSFRSLFCESMNDLVWKHLDQLSCESFWQTWCVFYCWCEARVVQTIMLKRQNILIQSVSLPQGLRAASTCPPTCKLLESASLFASWLSLQGQQLFWPGTCPTSDVSLKPTWPTNKLDQVSGV